MVPPDSATAARDWRPQPFGHGSFRKVADPIVEPLWAGVRSLVHVAGEELAIVDAEGEDLTAEHPTVVAALLAATRAEPIVLDGYLTRVAARATVGVWAGPDPQAPSFGKMTRQMFVGGGSRDRHAELAEAAKGRLEDRLVGDDPVAYVAIDLLLLEADPLLDVPLLERKRLLESALDESELVRRGTFVRPPVHPWLGQWRGFGFRELAYKAANSRYTPGLRNDAWTTIPIPRR
jgi:ATP-dependent DNA ligase